MTIQINDESLVREIKSRVNIIAQQKVSEYVKACDIRNVANQCMQKKFNNACTEIIQNGSFYDKVAQHLAKHISEQIADEITMRISVDKVTELVAEKITERAFDNKK